MTDLAGRLVVVTGAAQGIGREVASRVAAAGAEVVLLDRNFAGIQETAELLPDGALRGLYQVDLAEPDELRRVGSRVAAMGVEGLVNVAGVGKLSPFLELTTEQWRSTLDINLTGTFVLCQVFGVSMVERGGGRIVNISSISGKTGSAETADYCASKAGVISLTQSCARALGGSGVTVNAVCPGLVWTPMWAQTGTWMAQHVPAYAGLSAEETFQSVVRALTPLQRPTTTQDVAAMVVYLLSPAAAAITGQAINVDGGIEVH